MLVEIQPTDLVIVDWRRLTLKTSRLLFFSIPENRLSQCKYPTRPKNPASLQIRADPRNPQYGFGDFDYSA
ncbi:MAG TPA: hypothetical protein VKT33_15545 [Candidatus Angelobacter sp.]|nr:hypothetical protein [Candidatus Angelobacter sp.]